MAVNIEDAGFEIRDVITWLYGSGFPKSLDISKAIDKAAGAERVVVGLDASKARPNKEGFAKVTSSIKTKGNEGHKDNGATITAPATEAAKQWQGWGTALKPATEHWTLARKRIKTVSCVETVQCVIVNTKPSPRGFEEVKELLAPLRAELSLAPDQWERLTRLGAAVDGLDTTAMSLLGSLLSEAIDLSTVSSWKNISDDDLEKVKTFTTLMATRQTTESKTSNSLASPSTLPCTNLNFAPNAEFITLARKPLDEKTVAANVLKYGTGGINVDGCRVGNVNQGRFPANLLLDEEAAAMLDEQSGVAKPKAARTGRMGGLKGDVFGNGNTGFNPEGVGHWPTDPGGGASRFFYCAKASKSDRNAGCEGMETKILARSNGAKSGNNDDNPDYNKDAKSGYDKRIEMKNHHPTCKPLKLMRYLCRLITPPGGTVLDPFMGSGSTGVAAKAESFQFIGIEREAEYLAIAKARIGV